MAKSSKRVKSDSQLAVAYIRVSTDDQHLGPEAQRASIEQWANREDIEIVSWHYDLGVSGGADVDDRPELVAALATLRIERAGSLVVAKRDRLARDTYIASTIERAVARSHARVICADGIANGETPADAFLRSILDAAAAYERALIKARTKAALQVKRSRGESTGNAPYGFRVGTDNKTLVRDEDEQQTLATLRALRAEGLSFRRLRQQATECGLLSRNGNAFTLQAIYAMVSDPKSEAA
jgi:DNA invertase Pin-like site-specific DNA recombinase